MVKLFIMFDTEPTLTSDYENVKHHYYAFGFEVITNKEDG